LAKGLEKMGSKKERRALRVNVDCLAWKFVDERTIELEFFLPAGSYATAVLHECLNYKIG
jgi:tRNA pseudouridine13 synthase